MPEVVNITKGLFRPYLNLKKSVVQINLSWHGFYSTHSSHCVSECAKSQWCHRASSISFLCWSTSCCNWL